MNETQEYFKQQKIFAEEKRLVANGNPFVLHQIQTIKSLTEENERLRDALEWIANYRDGSPHGGNGGYKVCAREALKDTSLDTENKS